MRQVNTEPSTPEDCIVAEIFNDLRNRRYLKWVFASPGVQGRICAAGCRSIDQKTQRAIKARWRAIIRKELAKAILEEVGDE